MNKVNPDLAEETTEPDKIGDTTAGKSGQIRARVLQKILNVTHI